MSCLWWLLLRSQILFLTAVAASEPIVSLDYGTFLGVKDGNLTKFLGVPFAQPIKRFELPFAPVPLHGLQNATAFGPACPQQALTPSLPFVTPNHTFISEACASQSRRVFASRKAGREAPRPCVAFRRWFRIWKLIGHRHATHRRTLYRSRRASDHRGPKLSFERVRVLGREGSGRCGDNESRTPRPDICARVGAEAYLCVRRGPRSRGARWRERRGHLHLALPPLQQPHRPQSVPRRVHGAPHLRLKRYVFLDWDAQVSGAPWPSPTVAAGQPFYDALVSANNCTDTPGGDTLRCLQDVPLDAFLATVDKTPDFLSYRSLSLVWRPRVDGDVVLRNPVTSVTQGAFAKIPFMSGDVDDEGTFFAFSSTNVTTDAQFVDYIHSNYLKAGTPAQVSRIVELYPRDPTLGSPFDTGTANQLTPEFKRIAAFEGDFLFSGLRRLFLRHAAGTQRTWSWLSKRGKSTLDLGAYHTSDIALFFPPTSNITDTVAVDALVNFINTLDPNTSGAPRSNTNTNTSNTLNSTIFWPAYTPTNGSLLTFADPAPLVTLTPDTFRGEQMEFLDALHLSGVSVVGL